jgi:hypothetical protein
MLNPSRRDFVVCTGLAVALGLDGRLAIAPAFAQKTADPAKGFVTYKVGRAEVTALYDGIWEKPHDPAFIANASVDDVKGAMTKAGLPADFVSIPFTVVVVRNGGKTVLCDSGTGGQVQPTAGKMMANMKAAVSTPPRSTPFSSRTCHPDHIFGLMEKDTNKAVFPNAEIVISDCRVQILDRPGGDRSAARSQEGTGAAHPGRVPDLEKHSSGERRARGRARHPLRHCAGSHARPSRLSSGVGRERAHDLERHRLRAGAGRANPGWHGQYDQDAATAEASRRKLLDRVDRRQDHDLRLPLSVPGRGHHRQGRHGYALTVMKA